MAQRKLTEGSVPLSLYRLTAPMLLGVSSSILVQTLEMGFIGQLSTEHVAAVTFTFPVTMVLTSIALGVGIGASSVIARSAGAGRHRDAKRLASHSIVLMGSLMALLSLAGWTVIDPLFKAMGAPASMLPLIHSYLDIYYPGAVLFTLTMIASSIMRASGNANVPGFVMTAGALFNLAIDPILIFGWFGLPRMELAGAAMAMTVTRFITMATLLHYVHRDGLIRTEAVFKGFKTSVARILSVGAPAAATQLIGPLSGTVLTGMVASHGQVVLASFGVATRLEAVAVICLFALSGSIGPFVGQNWGANRMGRVREGMGAACKFSLAWGLLAAAVMAFGGSHLASWVNGDEAVVAIAALYLLIVPISYGAWGVLMMASASFNALGKPVPSTVLSFTRMFLVNVPLAMLLNEWYGYQGIFAATALSNGIMGLAGYWWLRRMFLVQRPSPRPPLQPQAGQTQTGQTQTGQGDGAKRLERRQHHASSG